MTSGTVHQIPISSITVDRASRQRRELVGIPELAESIGRLGLMHPIVVTRNNLLIAGERRLEAHKLLGLPTILAHFTDEIDPAILHALELEENIKRVDIPWADRTRAIDEYHSMRIANEPEWTRAQTAEALGIDPGSLTRHIEVAREIAAGNTRVLAAPNFSAAKNIVVRNAQRAESAALLNLRGDHEPTEIICEDFVRWAESYDGPCFNFIHCDFPYGIGASSFPQGRAAITGGYEDSPETYRRLCAVLDKYGDRFIAESAHLMFWFNLKYYYHETLEFLTKAGWIVDPTPLIWFKSDNAGTIPNIEHSARYVYETAFMAYRGNRPVAKNLANCFPAPIVRGNHMSEKNQTMLEHFFSMFVDSTSAVLDPTCGSGASIRAAHKLGAARVLGLEINPEFAKIAQIEFAKGKKND